MNIVNKVLVSGLVGVSLAVGASSVFAKGGRWSTITDTEPTTTSTEPTTTSTDDGLLDYNEQTHLFFMREEEKLARDVYLTLGKMYPNSAVFGKIDDSEQRHMDAVKAMIEKYGYEDPNTNDNVGVFTGEEYGQYFIVNYNALVERASTSELEALYVGAFIEELDMMDINQCPHEIIDADNGIDYATECGNNYTDNSDITKLYDSLLDGSANHLQGYVKNIEKIIGAGAYQAQVLSQEEVDEILDR
ncbi:DUF2202 domain-containing protein [Pseudomonadota bacterium]